MPCLTQTKNSCESLGVQIPRTHVTPDTGAWISNSQAHKPSSSEVHRPGRQPDIYSGEQEILTQDEKQGRRLSSDLHINSQQARTCTQTHICIYKQRKKKFKDSFVSSQQAPFLLWGLLCVGVNHSQLNFGYLHEHGWGIIYWNTGNFISGLPTEEKCYPSPSNH